MSIDFDKTKNLMEELDDDGSFFDEAFSTDISSINSEIPDVIQVLRDQDVPDVESIVGDISANLDENALNELTTHVSGTLGDTMDRLSTFTSFCAMEDAIAGVTDTGGSDGLPEILGSNPYGDLVPLEPLKGDTATQTPTISPATLNNLNKAFGAVMSARSMVSSVGSIKDAANVLPVLKNQLNVATTAFNEAVTKHSNGQITLEELEDAREAKDEAEHGFSQKMNGIVQQAKDLATNLSSVRQKINQELAWFNTARAQLNKFSEAMRVQSLFSKGIAVQSVIGAVGSSSFLRKLKL